MSTIVCLKEGNEVILGTDSRFMKHDFSAVASDATQKVHEIAPATFIATSGFKLACEFQETRARDLARELGTADIQIIGEALARESVRCLEELVSALCSIRRVHERISQTVSGDQLLHGCVLAGKNARGEVGYFTILFKLVQDRVVYECDAYFGTARKIFVTAGDAALQFAQDMRIWTLPPVRAVQLILETLKRASSVIGGPDQIVSVDRSGSRWISAPPTAPVIQPGELAVATITAAVSMTSPTITVTNGTFQINLDSTNRLKATDTNTSTYLNFQIHPAIPLPTGGTASGLALKNSSGDTIVLHGDSSTIAAIQCISHTGSASSFLDATGFSVSLSGQTLALSPSNISIGGNQVISGRYPGPGNTTDTTDVAVRFNNLLAALRGHGLIT